MFVNVTESVQSPKRLKRPSNCVESIVRLQVLNGCYDLRRDPLEQGIHLILEIYLTEADRESVAGSGSLAVCEDELPNKMVKTGTEMIDDFTKVDTPVNGGVRCFISEHPNLLSIFNMSLMGNQISLGFTEDLDFIVKKIRYLFSTFDFGTDAIQYFGHNLGCQFSNSAIVTKRFVIWTGFIQALPVG